MNAEAGAAYRGAVDVDPAGMDPDDLGDDRQPKADAGAVTVAGCVQA